ncbi:6-hydroxy-3-succinoylpyridine 3-monooxygenase HspA [Vibrio cholerae]|nr:6-hydroxy-3-succinoylpyridine 3-monooxygenase HspA [Vibrio cholerae]
MKTIIYIDHFNFYFGLLKTTNFKWLDYKKLFCDVLLPENHKSCELVQIRFFSSQIKSSFHPKGQVASENQSRYFRALSAHLKDDLDVQYGRYSTSPAMVYQYSDQSPKKPISFDKIKVWKIEEKLTDVALSIAAYRDVSKGLCSQVVFCTNDSDISPALKAISEDFPNVTIGLVLPIKSEGSEGRRFSESLSQYSHWCIKGISREQLNKSQLPHRVKTDKKPIDKPEGW